MHFDRVIYGEFTEAYSRKRGGGRPQKAARMEGSSDRVVLMISLFRVAEVATEMKLLWTRLCVLGMSRMVLLYRSGGTTQMLWRSCDLVTIFWMRAGLRRCLVLDAWLKLFSQRSSVPRYSGPGICAKRQRTRCPSMVRRDWICRWSATRWKTGMWTTLSSFLVRLPLIVI